MASYNVPVHPSSGAAGQIAWAGQVADDLDLINQALPVVSGGLAGAVATVRFAGGTASGAPVSGTFATGDYVVDQSGSMWVCTAGGSPGTWVQVGAAGGGAMTNPMTSAGDLIKGGASGTPARLAIGSTGQALIVSGGAPAWGSVGFAGGGTGQATQQAAMDALAAAVTSGQFLRGNGTHVVMNTIQAADVPQLTNYAPSGLTGATTATRYVGGTASGAPASGTFSAGDFVITADGHIFVCTAGGTPGTWANAGSSSGVSTFNSRSGTVTPGNADYLAVASGGLSGATTAARLVGGTASGAPASGTFSAGDLAVDQSGNLWVCTAGGSPGTWVQIRGGTFPGAVAPAVVSLSQSGGNVAVNAALGNDFRLSLTASGWTISNPTSPADGQIINFELSQDATGSRTVSWGSAYSFGAGSAPTLSTGASKTDILGFKYRASATQWWFLGASLGF